MSTDICLDALVDWMTTSGHYDARDARNCKPGPNSYRSGSIIEPSDWGGRSVTGLQKAAGCKYIQTTSPSTYGTCDYAPETPAPCKFNTNDAHPWYTKGHAVWLRRQDGTIEFNDGGNVQSPDS